MSKAKPTKTARKWAFQEVSRTVHTLTIELPNAGDSQRLLLQSDVHWDNPHCDRDMFTRHLEDARKHDAPVLDNGDFFCAMQGKYDKRSSKKDLRPEHSNGNYLDALVSTAADALAPYGDLLTVRGDGNHETAISKAHETSLNERLCEALRHRGSIARHAGYSGWVRIYVKHNGGTGRMSFVLWYNHGFGGGGPVTRGVIQTNRTAVYVRDADVVWMGHTHDHWILPIEQVKLNGANRQILTRQTHVRTAGYKEEYGDGAGGFHIERGGAPKPRGAAWMEIKNQGGNEITLNITEAR